MRPVLPEIRSHLIPASLCALTVTFLFGIASPGLHRLLGRFDGSLTDLRHRTWCHLAGASAQPSPVTVIDIDERTLSILGPYGENYRHHDAQVLRLLDSLGAGSVTFDILFSSFDSTPASLDLQAATAISPRCQLANKLEDASSFQNPSDWIPCATASWQKRLDTGISLPPKALAQLGGKEVMNGLAPEFQSAGSTGLVNLDPDPDGRYRRLPLLMRFPSTVPTALPPAEAAKPRAYPALALETALRLFGRNRSSLHYSPGKFIEIGVPLRLWRTPDGLLQSSISGLTETMIRDLRASRTTILDLRNHPGEVLTPVRAPGNWIEVWWDPVRRHLSTSLLPLGGDALEALLNLPDTTLAHLRPGHVLSLGSPRRIPVDEAGCMRIFFAHPDRLRHVSFIDVLNRQLDPALIPGRSFIIGSSATALFDIVPTPLQERTPGVDLQATVLENIVSGDFLVPLPTALSLLVLFLIVFLTCLAASSLTPFWAVPLTLLLLAVGFTSSVLAFSHGLWTDLLTPLCAALVSLLALLARRWFREERERRFLKGTFKTYISPELIDQMVATRRRPQLGGEERIITAFFTDLQGFSPISEKLPPHRLVDLLNQSLGSLTGILEANLGTLDKYIGDSIVACFGAPAEVPDHARRALLTALSMQQRLSELRAAWTEVGTFPDLVPAMRMRIGISTGSAVTGNMGSSLRMSYTMIGDTVNLASRLESVSKQYGTFILASAATVEAAGEGFITREIDHLRVVGKEKTTCIHEVLGLSETSDHRFDALLEKWNLARRLYLKGDFAAARTAFEACLPLEPWLGKPGVHTCPSLVFADRCEHFLEQPPQDWDGIWTATRK